MVATVSPEGAGRRLRWKLFLWAVMAAAVLWTLAYRAGKSDPSLPEFVYVNF
jgi:hypothetical protein